MRDALLPIKSVIKSKSGGSIAANLLEEHGYRVLEAENASAALAVLETRK
jgi:CheY-like chemotaxis protein